MSLLKAKKVVSVDSATGNITGFNENSFHDLLASVETKNKTLAAGLQGAVIVNTCAVTAEAVRQARQTIRRLKRENPERRIIVTGCAAQTEPATFAAMPEVDYVIITAGSFDLIVSTVPISYDIDRHMALVAQDGTFVNLGVPEKRLRGEAHAFEGGLIHTLQA